MTLGAILFWLLVALFVAVAALTAAFVWSDWPLPTVPKDEHETNQGDINDTTQHRGNDPS